MSSKSSTVILIGSIVLFSLYFLGRLILGQEAEIYVRSTSTASALALTVVEMIYLLFFAAEIRLSGSRLHVVASVLITIALLLFITLNWVSGIIAAASAISGAAVATFLVLVGAILLIIESRCEKNRKRIGNTLS